MLNIKILLIEPNNAIGEVIVKSLQRSFEANVLYYQTSNEGIQKIKSGELFNLIIVRNQSIETAKTRSVSIAAPFFNLAYDMSLDIPILVIGQFEHTYKRSLSISEDLKIDPFNQAILSLLNLSKKDAHFLKLPKFVNFSIKNFYLMTTSPCDVYIKLTKKENVEYIKRLNINENFSKEDLVRYEDLGLKEFFISRDDYDVFLNSLFVQALVSLKKSKTFDEGIGLLADSFAISSELIIELGITPDCVALVDQSIQMMKSKIQQTDKLGLLMLKLLHNKMSYSYRHSYLICAISYTLLPRMEWGGGDQQAILLEKICLVSYFHDIYLQDERFVKIADREGLLKGKFTTREIDIINNHANRAATIVQTYPKLPLGVDIIIKQHHGVTNGVGFAEVLTTSVSPMAIFFMVVEDFVTNILAIPNPPLDVHTSMKEAIAPLKIKYQMPSYRKIVTEIESLIKTKN
jgi:HD-GYP domain-containing protein (c-di-GMP phosphodiesterase class II)